MKTILRILIILLVAALVSGALFLAVNNTSSSNSDFGGPGQPPALANGSGQSNQSRGEGGGDHEGASAGQGLAEIFNTLLKLAGITVIVLLIEKGVSLLTRKRPLPLQS